MTEEFRYREIPYNYTSLSDREIILRYFDEATLGLIDRLRGQRVTGRSARLLAEIIGDLFMVERNPYVLEDFLRHPRRLRELRTIHERRLETVHLAAHGNADALDLLGRVRAADRAFFERLAGIKRLRQRIVMGLLGRTARKNLSFAPFDRIAHSTDATDWRVEHPLAVVFPDTAAELPGIIATVRAMGLPIVPRGGGTGLTAGAVPVRRNTIVLNTEKLNRLHGITLRNIGGREIPCVAVEAGCVTEVVIDHCRRSGYIFATDPTSAWASTIGGNIAENAGGKKCVQWGTAIDNLLSWQIVCVAGDTLEIRRRDHPHRKIQPDDRIVFDVSRIAPGPETALRSIELHGSEIRKPGLGKDITNKALKGLPGIQKEGGDGIITRAEFVLYRPFAHCRTLCLEFFGRTMANASEAILRIRQVYNKQGPAVLTALEHFDTRYVRAIGYRNKSSRTEVPQAVLLIDVEGDDLAAVDAAALDIADIASRYDTEAIIARTETERAAFWRDRKNLGAIARHTNAFKLNEDVVIPLDALPAFAEFIERQNLDKELAYGSALAGSLAQLLRSVQAADGDEPLRSRLAQAVTDLTRAGETLARHRRNLDAAVDTDVLPAEPVGQSLFECFRDGLVSFAAESDILEPLRAQFHGYEELSADIERIAADEARRRIIIATHMHAGDGNVHVNIPVHSSDYLMMQEADATAATVIREAVRLGGVVSGEHGIGLTKLKFIDEDVLAAYRVYKRAQDPDDVFNPGKLVRDFPHHLVYTPSFRLLELEAYILEATDLKTLSEDIASCVRCGKCKPVCCTHIPAEGMLYNPRNKILAVGQITEAVLYHAQTMEMRSFKHFRKLKDVSDHCTACHKCRVPCPVKIDFGTVTLAMRELQSRRAQARRSPAVRFALHYLWRRTYAANAILRRFVFRPGFALQRAAHELNRTAGSPLAGLAPRMHSLLDGRISARGVPSFRERLRLRSRHALYALTNASLPVVANVVYFPGCGSERLYPEISIATLALLYHAGVRTFLPPAFTCCGFPFQANGLEGRSALRSFENRVVFHRMADCIGASEIDAVLVSCGTCYEMLESYDLGKVFRNAPLLDINEFLALRKMIDPPEAAADPVLYHEPCHTPLRSLGYVATIEALLGTSPTLIPECCGDAGTLAFSRPDISCLLRRRKANELPARSPADRVNVLTTCPSCVAGLSKLRVGRTVAGRSLVVEVAERTLGKRWEETFVRTLSVEGLERIPL